jgi:drug/metabolite transporter (DMT)-like permease
MPATVSSFVGALIEVVVAAAMGLGIYLTARQYYKRRWLQQHGLRTLGVVVRLEADTGDFEAAYYPVVRFQPAGHPHLEARYDIGNTPPTYAIGQTVTLLYDPTQPTRFVIGDESGQGWAWLLALGLIGGILAYCLHYNLVL